MKDSLASDTPEARIAMNETPAPQSPKAADNAPRQSPEPPLLRPGACRV